MKTTLTALFLLLSLSVFAQRNFVPARYVTLQGDTVQAYIHDKNWDQNPLEIEVKASLNSDYTQAMGVGKLKAFILSSGDQYQAFIVDVDKSPYRLNDIIPGVPPVIERDTVFLRAIVQGQADLYFYKDENKKEHYYLRVGDDTPAELVYRIRKQEQGGKIGYAKLPLYKGLLTALLGDCDNLTKKIEDTAFKLYDLKETVTAYNNCIGNAGNSFVAAEEKIKFNFIGFAGLTYTTLDINAEGNSVLTKPSFSGANYTAGVGLIATVPRGRGRWSFQLDGRLKPFEAEATEGQTTTRFRINYLGLDAAVRYKIVDAAIAPYISAGVASNFVVHNNSEQVISTSRGTTIKSPLQAYRNYEQGLFLSIGAAVKKLQAEARFERGNGFSPYLNMQTFRNTFSLGVGYIL